VQTVGDGQEMLDAAVADPPDLIISDVMMPGMNGLAATEALRSNERTRMIPVLLLSARAGDEATIEGLRSGADDYLIKLEGEGYSVITATDGLDALDRLRSAQTLPGLILLDLMMPRMGGAQFRDELTKNPEWSTIPVVVLTADVRARTKAEALRVADVLTKPIKLDRLLETLDRVLQKAD
jgi:CheY-like chemotaxis protein